MALAERRARHLSMNYWLVKGNRDNTDWGTILSPGEKARWWERRLPAAMQRGDRVFYWMTYPDLRVIGLGTILETEPPDEKGLSHFWVESLTQQFHHPLTMDALRGEPIVADASFLKKGGPHDTVYPLTEEQARRIHQMAAEHNELPTNAAGWFHPSSSPPSEELLGELDGAEPFDPASIDDGRQRVLRSIAQRQGQATFRRRLFEAYGGRCALTDCEVPWVLEAAHIFPHRGQQTNHVTNGLLLRADLHVLFDLGLLRVDPESLTVELDPSLRGSPYTELSGRKLRLPASIEQRPSIEALAWHAEQSRSGASLPSALRKRKRV
jgi:predicted RNA-binding protein with PUA-like domain